VRDSDSWMSRCDKTSDLEGVDALPTWAYRLR